MFNRLLTSMSVMAVMLFTVSFFSCSDSDEPKEPENPNKVFKGEWGSSIPMSGFWLIDENGNAKTLQFNHVMVMTNPQLTRDSSYISLDREFKLDYNPETQLISMLENGVTSQYTVKSMEPTQIVMENGADAMIMKKKGEMLDVAPETIDGFYVSASRFKYHGIRFLPNNKALQYFYLDEITDKLVSEYTYTKGEGTKAHLSYHVKFFLNPEKQKLVAGKAKDNATVELTGELDLNFLSHTINGNDDHYFGEMEGSVHMYVVNYNGKTSEGTVSGKRYFALSKAE